MKTQTKIEMYLDGELECLTTTSELLATNGEDQDVVEAVARLARGETEEERLGGGAAPEITLKAVRA